MSADGRPRRQGFWLTAGEIVGALALVIAGLNLWESHQQRLETARQAARDATAQTAFVAQGQVSRDGLRVALSPLSANQAISAERYVFPSLVLGGAKEVSAAQPRIEADWVASGLRRSLQNAHIKGPGYGRVPVVIQTTYVEGGDTRQDTSLYELGYNWKPRLFEGVRIRLDGLSLVRRGVIGSARKLVDQTWGAQAP